MKTMTTTMLIFMVINMATLMVRGIFMVLLIIMVIYYNPPPSHPINPHHHCSFHCHCYSQT